MNNSFFYLIRGAAGLFLLGLCAANAQVVGDALVKKIQGELMGSFPPAKLMPGRRMENCCKES
jgi:hypothetical protein